DIKKGNTKQGNTQQGNTKQGNTQQGDTQQGNTQQGDTQQGDTQQRENTESFILNKEKLNYMSVIAIKEIPNSNIEVKESNNKVTVISDGAWIVDIQGKEYAISKSDNYQWGESLSTFSASQIKGNISDDISKEFPENFIELKALMNSPKYRQSRYYATQEEFNNLAQGLDTGAAIDRYLEILNSDLSNKKSTAEDFFVNYLRLNPYAVFDVVNLLDGDPKREKYDQSTHLILWRLVAESGHTEAQRAVIQAATDPKYSDLTQMRAIAYIHDFENPQPFLTEELWKLHKSLSSNTSDKHDAEIRDMALYAIGSLGAKEKVNSELKAEIGKQLSEYLVSLENIDDQVAVLNAIGNYGGSDIIDDITPFLSSDQEEVRGAAYTSMCRMDDPSAVELLINSYYREESPAVQKSAIKSLSSMPVTEDGIKFAKEEVLKSDNSDIQIPLIKLIGKNLNQYPENEKVFRELLENQIDNKVKKEIYRYIIPK
ncbi:MAG: HEAT repeat domain-containing protein, partial [Desulfamplus sp.]|nr:HEAT repeat domain-containing protein [Desulfamplus sp.]